MRSQQFMKNPKASIYFYKKDFQKRFSLDKKGNQYRLEVYCGAKYTGTFVLNYVQELPENPVYSPLE